MKKYIAFIALSTLLIACGNQKNNPTSVFGNIANLEENTSIYLDYVSPTEVITKDSAIVDSDGNYTFKYVINETAFYRLRINERNLVTLVLEKNETPTINGDGNNLMDTYVIENSTEANRLKQFNEIYKKNIAFQDSLGRFYQANPNDPKLLNELKISRFNAVHSMKQQFIQLINDKPASLVSLAIVQQLEPKEHIDLLKKVDNALFKKMPNSVYVINFHDAVSRITNLSAGNEAPEITLNNPDGNPISLSSLRGKTVLLDFWASWCRPCRAENPNVVKAYQKYNSKGFEVFSVSLDGMPQQQNAKKNWLSAIEQDGLIWKNHVSDLQGWNSSVVKLYGIEGIPFTLLIDKNGIIIGQNLRGVELENKLAEIFE